MCHVTCVYRGVYSLLGRRRARLSLSLTVPSSDKSGGAAAWPPSPDAPAEPSSEEDVADRTGEPVTDAERARLSEYSPEPTRPTSADEPRCTG